MGILNALTKLGCEHDWGWWTSYDNSFVNPTVAMHPIARLRACYEYRRCTKCKGLDFRWNHNWHYDQESVQARRDYEREHGDFGTGGPTLMMECGTCGKRDPYYVVMGD